MSSTCSIPPGSDAEQEELTGNRHAWQALPGHDCQLRHSDCQPAPTKRIQARGSSSGRGGHWAPQAFRALPRAQQ